MTSNCKIFADDTSLFSAVNDIQTSVTTLSNDLTALSNRAFQLKIIIISRKIAPSNSLIQYYSFKQKYVSETRRFNTRYKIKIFGT